MKSICLSLFAFFVAIQVSVAQGPMAYPPAVISFSFFQQEGTNGSAVAWNPTAKVYYAVIAGNADYPLESYDAQGKLLGRRKAEADIRGLWWNPKAKALQGNCAGEMGWVQIRCDAKGLPGGAPETLASGQNQPDFQSVGAYDTKGKKVVFYDQGSLYFYNAKNNQAAGTLSLSLPVSSEDINFTSVGFTGKKNYEFVLLDYVQRKLYFFNRKGNMTAESNLPFDAPANDAFRFSFTNGIAFVYDAETRTWTGFKVF